MRTDRIDPDATGVFDVVTMSGARYRLTIPPDGRTSVVRIPDHQPPARHWLGRGLDLRRDYQPIEVVAWGTWDQLVGLLPGVVVGACMVLVLEPLGTNGNATTRITTPVASIRELDPPPTAALTH